MLAGPELGPGEGELGMAGNIFILAPSLLVPAMVIWASTGRCCLLQPVLIPSQFPGEYVMPHWNVDPPSAFFPYQNFSEVVFFFFFFWYHSFPPRVLFWSLEGSKEDELTDKITSLSCVYRFFVPSHQDSSLHLFRILRFQNCFCVWGDLIRRLLGGAVPAGVAPRERGWTVAGHWAQLFPSHSSIS